MKIERDMIYDLFRQCCRMNRRKIAIKNDIIINSLSNGLLIRYSLYAVALLGCKKSKQAIILCGQYINNIDNNESRRWLMHKVVKIERTRRDVFFLSLSSKNQLNHFIDDIIVGIFKFFESDSSINGKITEEITNALYYFMGSTDLGLLYKLIYYGKKLMKSKEL